MAAKPKLVETETQSAGRKRAPEGETPRARFVRVASLRLNNTLDAIRLLGQIGTSSEYEYSPADAEKMLKMLADELSNTATKLRERKKGVVTQTLFD